MVISFCGHRYIFCQEEILKKITFYLNKIIKKNDNVEFYLGGYGDFDEIARIACTKYKKTNPNSKLFYITPYINITTTKMSFLKKFMMKLFTTLWNLYHKNLQFFIEINGL